MTDVHHENPNTYADSWEDCLVVYEGKVTENANAAEYWGGKSGDAIASFCDWTDGPVTRVRFVGDADTLRELAPTRQDERRLLPSEHGEFVVYDHHEGQGPFDCALMKVDKPIEPEGVHAITVEKWVPKEHIADVFPIGRRFTLKPLASVDAND